MNRLRYRLWQLNCTMDVWINRCHTARDLGYYGPDAMFRYWQDHH